MIRRIKNALIASATTLSTLFLVAAPVSAAPTFTVTPFEFVGTAADCGGPAGTDTVTAEWVESEGSPEPALLLEKTGATTNCAAAGAEVDTSLEGGPITALTELGFDYKDGGHCGAGAPRFNVVVDGNTYFLGCSGGTQTPAPTEGWTRVTFDLAAMTTAGIPATGTIDRIAIIFDEGSDTVFEDTTITAGTVYLDNINVNGERVGEPEEEAEMPTSKDDCKKGKWADYEIFKNQGDCVSWVATNHRNPATGLVNF
jgi:hypothetical protein